MPAYNEILFVVVLVMGVIALMNVLFFRSLRRNAHITGTPMVSVLLPARNEEQNIGIALSTLAEQDYPNYEVIVLDDNSDDATEAIAGEWTLSNPRIRMQRGQPLPAGWVGKSFACHQLAAAARGELLLFVDADTVHGRESIRAAVAELQDSGADLLTVIPRQSMRTFWERVILPLLHFSTFCFLPMPLVSATRNPKLAMANGQFMLFRRKAYLGIGGHKAVRTAIVEDVWLSRRVKEYGYRLAIRDGGEMISCRMYRSLREIWNGFSKNLFAGFQYSILMIASVIVFNMLTSVIPFVLFVWGAGSHEAGAPWFAFVTWQVLVVLAIRVLLATRFRLDLWSCLLHPLAMLVLTGIAINSCRWILAGGGARWKGRSYDFHNQPIPEN